MNEVYFAIKSVDEIINDLDKKVQDYDRYLSSSGLLTELRDSYTAFVGDSTVKDAGQQGELKAVKINHYASLIRNLVSLVTNNRPAFQPISANTDSSSQGAAILATGLLDFYMRDRRLERAFKNTCLQACYLRESWMSATWDTQQGEIIHAGDQDHAPIREGDLAFDLYNLVDVIRDFQRLDQNHSWLITRQFKNKFDLIQQFPEFESEISSASGENKLNLTRIRINQFSQYAKDDDQVAFYTFYHKQSASVPQGRMITFVKSQVLTDNALPYNRIPLVKLSAEDTTDWAFGHSPMLDVLGPQKVIDTLASTLLSNNVSFGVQNLWSKKGSGLSVKQFAGGLNWIESDVKPEPLQLTASSPETYKFLDMMVQQSQLLSGVNAAIRGTESAGMSGAALALLSNNALQYSNSLQQGYTALIEDIGSLAISILQRYANTKRVAVLTGKHNQPLLKEWSSSDLQGISRVTIDSGNALSKTASGRLTIADSLLKAGQIKRPQEYIQVLTTGNLEPIYENEQQQNLLIKKENELLADGKPVRALLTDDHDNHILEHASVLSNPDVRQDPNSPVVANTLAHIQEHLNIAQSMPPALAMLLKQQPLPQPPPQQGPPPSMPQQPHGPTGPQIPNSMDGTNSIQTEAEKVNGPHMPKIAGTNQRFEPNNN
jgi:hypothetical protein